MKMHGGTTIVQDPMEATYPQLCRTAVKYVKVDHILTLSEIAALLLRLVIQPAWRKFAQGQPQAHFARRNQDKC